MKKNILFSIIILLSALQTDKLFGMKRFFKFGSHTNIKNLIFSTTKQLPTLQKRNFTNQNYEQYMSKQILEEQLEELKTANKLREERNKLHKKQNELTEISNELTEISIELQKLLLFAKHSATVHSYFWKTYHDEGCPEELNTNIDKTLKVFRGNKKKY